MPRRVIVRGAEVYRTGGQVAADAGTCRQLVERLYAEIEFMGQAWQGADNLAYVQQVEGFRSELESLATAMDAYAAFLKTAAAKYSIAQQRALQAARRAGG